MRTFAADADAAAARTATKALFVDLSGVLLDSTPSPGRHAGLRGGAGAALRLLERLDFRLVIIAPCTLDRRRAGMVAPARIADLLFRERIALAAICCCDSAGTACDACAPSPELLLRAARDHRIALPASWLLASGPHYIAAGQLAGCRTVLIGDDEGGDGWPQHRLRGDPHAPAVYRSRDILDAALAIVRLDEAGETDCPHQAYFRNFNNTS